MSLKLIKTTHDLESINLLISRLQVEQQQMLVEIQNKQALLLEHIRVLGHQNITSH